MSDKSNNGFIGVISMPQDNTGATFNDGAFAVGATASLGTGTFTDIAATTGTGPICVSGFQVQTDSGDLSIEIYGDTLAFTGGTALPAFNTNKTSSKLPNLTALVQDPTVSVLGDLQMPPFAIMGNNTNNTINSILNTTPIIFKPLTNYMFRLTHNDAQTRTVSILLTAFENIIDQPTF